MSNMEVEDNNQKHNNHHPRALDQVQWFGAESIQELSTYCISTTTSPVCARGTFGEISLALLQPPPPPPVNEQPSPPLPPPQVVAIKTFFQPCEEISSLSSAAATATYDAGEKKKRKKKQVLLLRVDVWHEIAALRKLQTHSNIVELVAVYQANTKSAFDTASSLSLAFMYCPIDLALSLEWRRQRQQCCRRQPNGQGNDCCYSWLLPMEIIRLVVRDIMAALLHCHEQGIVHRDIKPGNFLVSSSGYIQLCDFGLARPWKSHSSDESILAHDHNDDDKADGLCTLYYRPPEVLLGLVPPSHTHPSLDIYSAGLVLVELLTGGRVLFPGINELDQLSRIFKALGTPTESNWTAAAAAAQSNNSRRDILQFTPTPTRSWSELVPRAMESLHLLHLLERTVALDPFKRLTTLEVCQHAWMQDQDDVHNSNNSGFSPRSHLIHELIPMELDTPFLLNHKDDNSSNNSDLVIRQTLHLANQRKNLLKQFDTWRKMS